MYKILTVKWMQLLVHLWRNGKQQLDSHNKDRQYGNLFSASPYEFHWATRPADDNAISANSLLSPNFSLRSVDERQCATSTVLQIIQIQGWNREGGMGGGGGCQPVLGTDLSSATKLSGCNRLLLKITCVRLNTIILYIYLYTAGSCCNVRTEMFPNK